MNAQSAQVDPPRVDQEPSVGGVRVRPFWSVVLYALLVSSAALALYAQRLADVDPLVAKTAPWVFLAFAIGFAVYRIALVAARRYSPFKAFIQVFVAALFFMLLLAPAGASRSLPGLLGHREAAVRALAARAAGLELDQSSAPALVVLLEDPAPEVRASARQALVRLNGGADLGPSVSAWKERFK
jgi:hypothetical protein